jgi:4,5-DOPA dioxygenase extradiol
MTIFFKFGQASGLKSISGTSEIFHFRQCFFLLKRSTFLKSLGLAALPFSMNSLHELAGFADALSPTDLMPVLFLGHGSPMNAIEENSFVQGFRKIAAQLPKPKAVLCVSAHWFISGTKVTAMPAPKTIHDFYGFPKALFDVQYPAKGSPELAKETAGLLLPVSVESDQNWGLDHGAWSVLIHLFPKADVPVIQLSIDYTKPPSFHFDLGQRLFELRKKGILIIGSGNMVHNLGMADFQNMNKPNYGYDWAIEARQNMNTWIKNGETNKLLEYQKMGKALQLAIPSPDHFLPLLYNLGLKQKGENISFFNDEMQAGSLSMTSLKIG